MKVKMIETDRLVMRPFDMSDAQSMFRNWASDPDVVRFLQYDVCETLKATEKHINQWFEYFNNLPLGSSWCLFAIELKSDGELIGTIDFHENDKEARAAEIGYQLGKAWWRMGYATEALRRVIQYCFEEVGLNRLWADHNSLNVASGKVLLKAGMLHEGTFRQYYVRKGELVDKCSYAILMDDWEIKNDIKNSIIPLEREQWEGHKFAKFSYTSTTYYDVVINRTGSDFNVSLVKKEFDVPFEMEPDDFDILFQPYWENVKAWGILVDGHLIAVIETAVEEWSNRLRVTELWVDDAYHRRGIATALMDIAIKRAKDEKRRVVMLETQSCNGNAIAFYLSYGFSLIGFDACAYQNNDLKRKEVRLELGIIL